MSIYITQQQKEAWELMVDGLQRSHDISTSMGDVMRAGIEHFELQIYKDLLSKSTVLPVEKSWEDIIPKENEAYNISDVKRLFKNGVIIK